MLASTICTPANGADSTDPVRSQAPADRRNRGAPTPPGAQCDATLIKDALGKSTPTAINTLTQLERETLEEANARVTIEQMYVTLSLPEISQVYVLFRAKLDDLDFGPGAESLEVKLFDEADIPWDQLAFRTIDRALKLYFADRQTAQFPAHVGELRRPK